MIPWFYQKESRGCSAQARGRIAQREAALELNDWAATETAAL